MTDLHEKLVIATKRAEHLEARNQRLADLVRYKRHELHLDGLISDEEYGEIVKDHGAVARLEGYDAVKAKCDRLEAEKVEYEQSFDLRHKADMRVIESWREGDPAKELIMPDHADLCVWLLGEWERLEADAAMLREALEKLANEASGFHGMADIRAHGVTNFRIMRDRIKEAREAIAATDAGAKLLEEHKAAREWQVMFNEATEALIKRTQECDSLRQRVAELERLLEKHVHTDLCLGHVVKFGHGLCISEGCHDTALAKPEPAKGFKPCQYCNGILPEDGEMQHEPTCPWNLGKLAALANREPEEQS